MWSLITCIVGNLAVIKKTCGDGNAPNLKTKVWICFKEEILSFPAFKPNSRELDGDVAFRPASVAGAPVTYPAGKWKAWEISKYDNSLISEPQGDGENRSYNDNVKFFINKQDAKKSFTVQSTNGAEVILLVKDANGQMRLIGDIDNGATVKSKSQTSPKNGYEVEVMCENQPNEAPFYSGAIVE